MTIESIAFPQTLYFDQAGAEPIDSIYRNKDNGYTSFARSALNQTQCCGAGTIFSLHRFDEKMFLHIVKLTGWGIVLYKGHTTDLPLTISKLNTLGCMEASIKLVKEQELYKAATTKETLIFLKPTNLPLFQKWKNS